MQCQLFYSIQMSYPLRDGKFYNNYSINPNVKMKPMRFDKQMELVFNLNIVNTHLWYCEANYEHVTSFGRYFYKRDYLFYLWKIRVNWSRSWRDWWVGINCQWIFFSLRLNNKSRMGSQVVLDTPARLCFSRHLTAPVSNSDVLNLNL